MYNTHDTKSLLNAYRIYLDKDNQYYPVPHSLYVVDWKNVRNELVRRQQYKVR